MEKEEGSNRPNLEGREKAGGDNKRGPARATSARYSELQTREANGKVKRSIGEPLRRDKQ